MYTDEPTDTFDGPFDAFEEDFDLQALALARGRVPSYWDAEDGALAYGDDPDDHGGGRFEGSAEWEAPGWDDPAEAAEVLERTVVEDARLLDLAETPIGRPRLAPVADLLEQDVPGPEEELLALVEDQLGAGPGLAEGVAA